MSDEQQQQRILDTDELIELDETLSILGGMAISTAYTDADLMALKISMTAGEGRRSKAIRFIRREILELRARRVERASAKAANVAKAIEERVERRRERQRVRVRATA